MKQTRSTLIIWDCPIFTLELFQDREWPFLVIYDTITLQTPTNNHTVHMHDKGNIIRVGTFFQHIEKWSFHSSAEEPIPYRVFQCKTQVYFSIWINLNFSWVLFLSQNLSSFSQDFFQNIFSKHPLKHAVPCHNNSIFFLVSCVRINIWTRGVTFHPQMERKESISPRHHSTAWKFKINELNIQIPGKEFPAFLKYTIFYPQVFALFFPHNGWGSRNGNKVGPSTLRLPELIGSKDLL